MIGDEMMRKFLLAGAAVAILGLAVPSFAQTGGSGIGGQPGAAGSGPIVKAPSGASGGGPTGGTGTNQRPSGTQTTIPQGSTSGSGSSTRTMPANPNKTLDQQQGTSSSSPGMSGSGTSGSGTSGSGTSTGNGGTNSDE
jgi:hypothetical protein